MPFGQDDTWCYFKPATAYPVGQPYGVTVWSAQRLASNTTTASSLGTVLTTTSFSISSYNTGLSTLSTTSSSTFAVTSSSTSTSSAPPVSTSACIGDGRTYTDPDGMVYLVGCGSTNDADGTWQGLMYSNLQDCVTFCSNYASCGGVTWLPASMCYYRVGGPQHFSSSDRTGAIALIKREYGTSVMHYTTTTTTSSTSLPFSSSSPMSSTTSQGSTSITSTTSWSSPGPSGPASFACPAQSGQTVVDPAGASYILGCAQDSTNGVYAVVATNYGFNDCFQNCSLNAVPAADGSGYCTAFTYAGGTNGVGYGVCLYKAGTPEAFTNSNANLVAAIKASVYAYPTTTTTTASRPTSSPSALGQETMTVTVTSIISSDNSFTTTLSGPENTVTQTSYSDREWTVTEWTSYPVSTTIISTVTATFTPTTGRRVITKTAYLYDPTDTPDS